jgi:purine nucleoside phosphorylase
MSPTSRHDFDDAAAADYIRARIDDRPKVALVTGTGLGEVAASLRTRAVVDYSQIPHFPVSTVQSHQGRLIEGQVNGQQVLGLSVITNMCLPDAPTPAQVDAIIAAAQGAAPYLETIIGRVIERLDTRKEPSGKSRLPDT